MRILQTLGLLMLVFSITFLGMTALCDWLCWHSSYYLDAQNDVVIMED